MCNKKHICLLLHTNQKGKIMFILEKTEEQKERYSVNKEYHIKKAFDHMLSEYKYRLIFNILKDLEGYNGTEGFCASFNITTSFQDIMQHIENTKISLEVYEQAFNILKQKLEETEI